MIPSISPTPFDNPLPTSFITSSDSSVGASTESLDSVDCVFLARSNDEVVKVTLLPEGKGPTSFITSSDSSVDCVFLARSNDEVVKVAPLPEEKGPKNYSPALSIIAAACATPATYGLWERKAAAQLKISPPSYCFKGALGAIPLVVIPLSAHHFIHRHPKEKEEQETSLLQTLKSSAIIAAFSTPFVDNINRRSGGQKGWMLLTRSPTSVYVCIFFSELAFLNSVLLHPWIERLVHKNYGDHPWAVSAAKAANGALLMYAFQPLDTAALRYAFNKNVAWNWKNSRKLYRGASWNMLAAISFNLQMDLFERLLKKTRGF